MERETKDILISVVVPIFNVSKYLKQCIESLLCQNSDRCEFILVDDGSTDNSGLICDEYSKKDCRIHVVHKENGGLVSARKAGLKVAKGQYIVCIDGDDWVSDDYLSSLEKIANEYSPDIICNGYFDEYENTNRIIEQKPRVGEGFYSKERIEECIYPILICPPKGARFHSCIWSKAYKRELYAEIQNRVDDKVSINEDTMVSLPCMFLANSMYVIDKCFYHYRKNDSSMTGSFKSYCTSMPRQVYEFLNPFFGSCDLSLKEQFSRRIVETVFVTGVTQFYNGDFFHTAGQIKKMLREDYVRTSVSVLHILFPTDHASFLTFVMYCSVKYKFVLPMWFLAKKNMGDRK